MRSFRVLSFVSRRISFSDNDLNFSQDGQRVQLHDFNALQYRIDLLHLYYIILGVALTTRLSVGDTSSWHSPSIFTTQDIRTWMKTPNLVCSVISHWRILISWKQVNQKRSAINCNQYFLPTIWFLFIFELSNSYWIHFVMLRLYRKSIS